MSKSNLSITIKLDDQKIPKSISLKDPEKETDCKAMMLSFFDRKTKDTLKIDLWTKEMQVLEMDRFVFESLRAMADTYYKSTGNKELANELQRFTQYFGQKTGIVTEE
ncbi:MAG: gliding motility protein GldC [Bacteroidia bacterium]|nr:gliding motility protein GldC [Bacteroidia bacterium]